MKLLLLIVSAVVCAADVSDRAPSDKRRHVALIGEALVAPPPRLLIPEVRHPVIPLEPHPVPLLPIPSRIPKYLPPKFDLDDGSYIYKPPQCPRLRDGTFGTCASQCSRDHDCPQLGHKCCSNGCGTVCVRPVFEHPGRCPVPTITYECKRGHSCEEDNECESYEKCCSNDCGSLVCRPAH